MSKILPETCSFIKKEALAQVFSCEFCEISKNTFFYTIPPVVGSGHTVPSKYAITSLSITYKMPTFCESRKAEKTRTNYKKCNKLADLFYVSDNAVFKKV